MHTFKQIFYYHQRLTAIRYPLHQLQLDPAIHQETVIQHVFKYISKNVK